MHGPQEQNKNLNYKERYEVIKKDVPYQPLSPYIDRMYLEPHTQPPKENVYIYTNVSTG